MSNWTPGPAWRGLLALGLAGLAAGCGLGDRARALYFQQQRASGALVQTIGSVEGAEPALTERLYDTEDALAEACAPLREAGARKFNRQEIDDDLEWAIVDALDGCAQKTAEVEALIWTVDPQTAQWFLEPPRPDPDQPDQPVEQVHRPVPVHDGHG